MPSMLLADNVLDLKAYPVVALMQQAILTEARGALPHLPTQSRWNMSAHADTAAKRARAFTMDMIWLSIMY